MINGVPTYVSLFSSTGVGCYGFKEVGYKCIATSELLPKRIEIQKINNKCDYESGYICGDITSKAVKGSILAEIIDWQEIGNDSVDVLIATPPCQGMSVANQKKSDGEIVRNSLIVEAIQMTRIINPKVFIFENVAAFMKTSCTNKNGYIKPISEVINEELGKSFNIVSKVLNFKNYGNNSSRTRTLVIGVRNGLNVNPETLFPDYREEKTLREVIGDMPKLEWGEIDKNDFYHNFRVYKPEMRAWIHDLKEGESAFDNVDLSKRPHKVVDGQIVLNQNKAGDKYKRQYWDKVAPCIHTRMDIFSSQNTVHPSEDRVFSIRELMRLMSIPDTFKWIDKSLEELNSLSLAEKQKLLKKEELTIRRGLGEAVPTGVLKEVATKIKVVL